jgi:uncharacterized protein (DUF2141 family)
MPLALAIPLLGAGPPASLDVGLSNLRNAAGHVRLCLTRDPAFFPDCKRDPRAWKLSAPADEAGRVGFSGLPSGDYALAVIHDENDNARLDTFARIPREGVGFSRNPALRFGPPAFRDVSFAIGSGRGRQDVRMRYFL